MPSDHPRKPDEPQGQEVDHQLGIGAYAGVHTQARFELEPLSNKLSVLFDSALGLCDMGSGRITSWNAVLVGMMSLPVILRLSIFIVAGLLGLQLSVVGERRCRSCSCHEAGKHLSMLYPLRSI